MSRQRKETVSIGDHFRLGCQRRGISLRDNRLKTHEKCRHHPFEEGCVDQAGNPIGRAKATQFPFHIKPGEITRLRKWLDVQWSKFNSGHPSEIINCQKAGSAWRITVRVKRFGLRKVGGFVRNNLVVTLFPEEAAGGNGLGRRRRPEI